MKSILLYQFKGFDFDIFKSLYLYEILPREERKFIPHVPMADFFLRCGRITEEKYLKMKEEEAELAKGELVIYKGKTGVKDETKILNKVIYLQDSIIRRANAKKDSRAFSLSSQLLKAVIGNEYKQMLTALTKMGFISLGDGHNGSEVEKYHYYQPNKYSMIYSIPSSVEVETISSTNATIKKYKEKTSLLLDKYIQEEVYTEVDRKLGDSFRKNYITSLNYITIENTEGFNQYVDSVLREHPYRHLYYDYLKAVLLDKDKKIQKIDNSGRVYHVLTNCERELKDYLNISYSLDCKNSHPLLFNFFIFNYYNISYIDSYNISSFLYSYNIDLIQYHNVGKYIRNILNDNNILKDEIAKLPDDVLEYIYLTSKGKMWDEFVELHPDMDRAEMKVEMFKQVFYSNTPYIYEGKELASEFKERFPNVYKLIAHWKKRKKAPDVEAYMEANHLFPNKPTASLSMAMMNLESKIFTEILKRIYRKRWRAVHIHDCIVVPKTGKKNQPEKSEVLEIMREVYQQYGLRPTFD